jgi:hypothetical protein
VRTSGYRPSGGTALRGRVVHRVQKGVVAVSAATGTFHISHPRLYGPAERTVIEPWLTQLSHLTMNAYAEPAAAEAAVLTVVESLPAPRPAAGRRPVMAQAA